MGCAITTLFPIWLAIGTGALDSGGYPYPWSARIFLLVLLTLSFLALCFNYRLYRRLPTDERLSQARAKWLPAAA